MESPRSAEKQRVRLSEKSLDALRRIIDYEERRVLEMKRLGFPEVAGWELLDIPVEWHDVKPLIMSGIVIKRAKKWYVLADRERAKKILEEHLSSAPETLQIQVEEPMKTPEDLFGPIIGYDNIKDLFKRAIKNPKPIHILLIGPPSSAKTLFLLEIGKLRGAFYCLGGSTTKVGLIDQLFGVQPRYLLVDELEKMNKLDYAALLSLMETGIVKETKHEKTREITLKTSVFAACNSIKGIPPELLSRFHFKLKLSRYPPDEFKRVAVATLVLREGVPHQLAEYIAERIKSEDIREVVGIARCAATPEEVDELVKIKQKYGLH